MPSLIIQRLLQQQGILHVDVVPDDVKLKIYILALREIKYLLAKRKPRDIAQDSLVDYEDALQEISCAFYELRHKGIGKEFQLEQNVISEVDNALAHISAVLELVSKGLEYFQYAIKFRNIIFQVCSYFAEDDEGNVL